MKFIPLTNSPYKTIVDDEDYDRIMNICKTWCVLYNKDKKPIAIIATKSKNRKTIYLNRAVMNSIKDNGYDVDHRFGNIFDNRRSFQLRWATPSQNQINRNKQKNNTSGHKNIYWIKHCKKWRVSIAEKYYGQYNTIEEALNIRNNTLKKIYGEFSRV